MSRRNPRKNQKKDDEKGKFLYESGVILDVVGGLGNQELERERDRQWQENEENMYNTINVSEHGCCSNQLTMKNLRTDKIELWKMKMGKTEAVAKKMATTEEKYQKIFVINRYRVYIIYCSFPNCFIEIKFMTLFFLSYFLLFEYFHQAIQPSGSC